MLDTLTDWRDEWALELANGNVSHRTAVVYLRGIDQFIDWMRTHHPDIALPAVTRQHINGFLAHLVALGRKEGTRRVRLLALRIWLNYIIAQPDSGIDRNPTAGIPLPVAKAKPVPVVPDDALARLLDACRGAGYFAARDTAIIRVLLDTGIRRGELCGIDVGHVDLSHQEITVTGKGGKTRVVPIGSKTTLALRKYLRQRAKRPAADSAPLFLSYRPDAKGEWRLTGGGVANLLDRRCAQAGLGHMWPHMLRHTWAHDMLDNGANEQVVERLGGWADGSVMVRHYGASMADVRARRAAQQMSRGDRV